MAKIDTRFKGTDEIWVSKDYTDVYSYGPFETLDTAYTLELKDKDGTAVYSASVDSGITLANGYVTFELSSAAVQVGTYYGEIKSVSQVRSVAFWRKFKYIVSDYVDNGQ